MNRAQERAAAARLGMKAAAETNPGARQFKTTPKPAEPAIGPGRDWVRQNRREARTDQLRRGCLLILGRKVRGNRSGQTESTRGLLSQVHRLEADRRRSVAS